MTCTRCGSSGFLNIHQLPGKMLESWNQDEVLAWVKNNPELHMVNRGMERQESILQVEIILALAAPMPITAACQNVIKESNGN